MASTATETLGLDLQATGDNPNAWGVRLNQSLRMIDEAAGGLTINLTADRTLTSDSYVTNESRRGALRFTGAGGFKVTVPAVKKLYFIDNQCAADITIKTAANAGAVVRAGMRTWVYIDGITSAPADPTLDKIAKATAPVDLNGQQFINSADATTDTGLVTRQQTVALTSGAVALAQAWATQASGEVVTGQGFSALFNANLSKNWANQASGEVVTGQGFSALFNANRAKAWASQVSGEVVAGQGFSALYYAGLSSTSASASAGSAALSQQWAISLSLVDATYFGARKYAIDAAASAAAAALFDPASYYTKTASDARFAPVASVFTRGQIVGLSYGPDSLS